MSDVADLLDALLVARQWRNASNELRDWSCTRYSAMVLAFGVSAPPLVEEVDVWQSDVPPGPRRLFLEALASYDRLRSPFDGYLEVSGAVARMWRTHHDPIEHALDDARAAMRELMLDLLVVAWEIPPGMTVTDDQLRHRGFDPDAEAPDPVDFL